MEQAFPFVLYWAILMTIQACVMCTREKVAETKEIRQKISGVAFIVLLVLVIRSCCF